ncbi:metallophosphoesterase family protein [Leptolyngbya iicbica]|uniref:Serine/threonine protein phosphatase n=2 Tax=Cyanophyceae TaxID=3028117 RepID=A0A4Q7E5N8_9CYAN|nr:metallophosphoesterase family protein [Leptolyngbya sp. LK]RZM75436.1 serine/threonine protein phosphatase [Leptolyngbya sp. LK]
MSRRIFIGDIHGHYVGLRHLLDKVDPTATDQVYCVGDLIDRGPQSAKVVSFVREQEFICVLGNHEQLLLDAFAKTQSATNMLQAWLYSGGQSTLASYDRDVDLLSEHMEWFRTLPLHLDLGDIWLVHAGLDPTLAIDEQTANEFCWIRDAFHSAPNPYFQNKLIITGHTITFTFPDIEPGQIVEGPGWLDIDTGAYHPRSGWLTALDIDNEIVHQFNVFEATYRTRSLEEACSPFTQGRRRATVS